MEKYNITRYEEKSDALFICINHTEKPVYLEHFFTEEERATETSRKETIEKLVGQLYVMADEYIEPEKFVNKLDIAQNIKLDNTKILKAKSDFILNRSQEIDTFSRSI